MVMNKTKTYRLNKDTINKIEELMNKFSGDYPTRSQVVRSAIHYLYNKKIRDEVFKSELL